MMMPREECNCLSCGSKTRAREEQIQLTSLYLNAKVTYIMIPLDASYGWIGTHIALQIDVGAFEQVVGIERCAQIEIHNGCVYK